MPADIPNYQTPELYCHSPCSPNPPSAHSVIVVYWVQASEVRLAIYKKSDPMAMTTTAESTPPAVFALAALLAEAEADAADEVAALVPLSIEQLAIIHEESRFKRTFLGCSKVRAGGNKS